MNKIQERLKSILTGTHLLPPGTYHYQAPGADPRNYRLHLRLEPDGTGVLILNAATVLHLNQTAAEYAFYLVQNVPTEQAVHNIVSRYRVSREQAFDEYTDFRDRLDTLISTPDLDPVAFLGFDRQEPFSGTISAPYRLDCAITYRLPSEADNSTAPVERVDRELSTDEWISIINKAWSAGIPHLVFTGGEPTLREDLPQLIAQAERNNQVTGLLSDGLRLADRAYLDSLLQTGLDHLMLILQPQSDICWRALENALAADLFVAVHITLSQENLPSINELFTRLARIGVKAISLSTHSTDMREALAAVSEDATELGFELVWNLPVPYSRLNPVALETEAHEAVKGAGRAWLYVEPDGDVLPGQGIPRVVGNFLRDSWEQIWKQ